MCSVSFAKPSVRERQTTSAGTSVHRMSLRRGISAGEPIRYRRGVREKYLPDIGYRIWVDRSLDEHGEQLLGREMGLLDVCRDVRRDLDRDIGERRELAARPSRECEHDQTHRGGAFGRREDVRRVAARRDAEQDVTGSPQRLDLAPED